MGTLYLLSLVQCDLDSKSIRYFMDVSEFFLTLDWGYGFGGAQ